MKEETMAAKITSIGIIAQVFGGFLLKKILASPLRFARIIKFALKLKKEANTLQSTQDKAARLDSTMKVVGMLLEYRRTNPEEMETIIQLIEELHTQYHTSPALKQEILNLMDTKDMAK